MGMPTLNVQNRTLFHGDNLPFLRGINSNTIHLIATDSATLELDHNTPRSDGGLNHISNRLLLCGPCNRIKSNKLTLSVLRAENAKRGRMYGD